MRISKEQLREYFTALHKTLGDEFKFAAELTDQCMDDVWFEFDNKENDYITWHQVKPFMERAAEQAVVLEAELAAAKEAQANYIEEKKIALEKKLAEEEEERKRREEAEAEGEEFE